MKRLYLWGKLRRYHRIPCFPINSEKLFVRMTFKPEISWPFCSMFHLLRYSVLCWQQYPRHMCHICNIVVDLRLLSVFDGIFHVIVDCFLIIFISALHHSGIPFLTNLEKERLKEVVLERHSQTEMTNNPDTTEKSPKFISPATNKSPMEVPEEEKEFLDGIWWINMFWYNALEKSAVMSNCKLKFKEAPVYYCISCQHSAVN